MDFHPEHLRQVLRYAATYKTTGLMAANLSDHAWAAASNTAGAILWRATGWSRNTTSLAVFTLAAHTALPNSVVVGDVVSYQERMNDSAGLVGMFIKVERPIFIPAGKGLYFTANVAESNAARSVVYTLLS